MAALTITTSNVVPAASATTINGTAGNTLTIGSPVYQASDGDYEPTNHNALATAAAVGICLTNAVAGQPCTILTKGELDFGSILTAGMVYVVGNAAEIIPIGDLASSDYVTVLGVAKDADTLIVNPIVSGVQRA